MIKKYVLLVFILMLVLLFTGCLIDIKSDVDYPAGLFKQTLKKIESLHAKDPGRKGTVSNLNILVYDGDDRQLIKLSFPITTASETLKGIDFENDESMKKYTRKIGGIKLKNMDFLDRMGPGLLLETEVEEENHKVHALIWLD
jgi:major membrane immunogen (membrane-anchored lipoprotein)